MITHPLTDDPAQDPERVREFFDQWQIYRRVLELDYLHHRDAYAVLARALAKREGPFSFLDLGAGDAVCTTRVLASMPIARYEAVDLSAVALKLAEENATALACAKTFTHADFVERVGAGGEPFDVIFIGLSLHHLPARDQRAFFPKLRALLAEGGSFFCYEPICELDETRDAVLARWWRHVEATWTELSPAELASVKDHVFGNDYPEPVADFETMAREARFRAFDVLYMDEQRLYALMRADA
jgi:ubiquinone/menaquinone biosynthesis C-methylase UbiE